MEVEYINQERLYLS
jgi:hypothetical protein